MEFWKYYAILKRRWLIITVVSLLVSVAVAFTQWRRPTEYKIDAQLKELPAVAEGSTVLFPAQLTVGAESLLRMGNLQRIIKSDLVMKELYEEVLADGPSRLQDVLTNSREPVVTLSSWYSVDLAPNSQFVIVSATAQSPEEVQWLSQSIITGVIRRYNALNQEANRTDRARLENELLPAAEKQLKTRRLQLAKYKQLSGIDGDPAAVSQAILTRASQYQNDYDKALVAMKESAARKKTALLTLKKDYAVDEYIELQNVMAANPIIQSLTTDELRAEAELGKQLEVKANLHPDIIALRAQIENLRTSIAAQSKQILNSQTKGRNPLRDAAITTLINAELDFQSSSKRYSGLKIPLQEAKKQLSKIPEAERRMAELQLAVQVSETSYSTLLGKVDEAKAREVGAQMPKLLIADPGFPKVTPRQWKIYALLSFFICLMLISAVILMIGQVDTTVRTAEDAENLLKAPVFALIPQVKHSMLSSNLGPSQMAASCQILSTNVWFARSQMQTGAVMIASADPNSGRSTTAANLALSLARDGANVILVDCDMRQPALHKLFGVDNKVGLGDYLNDSSLLQEIVTVTAQDQLLLITAGAHRENPVRALMSQRMADFVDYCTQNADFVIFDSPAGMLFADAMALAGLVKSVVLVQTAGRPASGQEREFSDRLKSIGANIIGVVVNRVKPADDPAAKAYRRSYSQSESEGHTSVTKALPGK
ncbi:MAG: polysaccharide biosynthesis tyrosine autokinase [Armatimonadota bacterium]